MTLTQLPPPPAPLDEELLELEEELELLDDELLEELELEELELELELEELELELELLGVEPASQVSDALPHESTLKLIASVDSMSI